MHGSDEIYDRMYTEGYREVLSPYDYARAHAMKHLVTKVLKLRDVGSVLDYGCGSGIYAPLWREIFTGAELYFGDISSVALSGLVDKYPEFKDKCIEIKEQRAAYEGGSFDVVVSVEVLEHVADYRAFLADILRLLKPGGAFIWTTPCANKFSIEHIYSLLTGQVEKTGDGFVRWKWEDPTHIRRFRTGQLRDIMREMGFVEINFRFRSHLFSFVYSRLFKGPLRNIGGRMLLWDYILFRNCPNGAAMLGTARKA